MTAKLHVKKDDMVVVISGAASQNEDTRVGKVLSVDAEKQRVVVEGVNVRKKTIRRSQQNPRGGIVEIECPIHVSNVMLQEKYDKKHGKGAK